MYLAAHSRRELKNAACESAKHGKKLARLLGKEAVYTTQEASKRFKKLRAEHPEFSYPHLRELALHHGRKLRHLLSKGGEIHITPAMIRSFALRFGIVCVVVKIFRNEHVAQTVDDVKTRIRRKPLQSAAIALGVGYCIAKILK